MLNKELPNILIVDDVPANVGILFEFLSENGFEVLVARNGENALQIAESIHPNLILLDIMMPGIDGFETCQYLKANPKTADIPVIFMTALADTVDKIKGLELGAVDYVTKPFHQEEVLARINTHLTIRQLQQQLEINNAELAAKNRALHEKNSELDAFAHTVAHDLKNPLSAIIGLTDLLLNTNTQLSPQALNYLKIMFKTGEKMVDIINGLLLLARISKEQVQQEPLNMQVIVESVQHRLMQLFLSHQGQIILPERWETAVGYPQWVEEVWANYMSNALKYGGKPPCLELGSTREGNFVRFWVKDNGNGLTAEAQSKLFAAFSRVTTGTEEGHGLGLSIVQRIINKLGGEIGVESELNKGSTFYFTLPTQAHAKTQGNNT
ncbi:sensor histidine kinase [Beggiatoa leptomitoformis]|uniref:histidine kinase n=1 Tax=Beggiatoa leptomitoformis TaxID=288004 RepID=A0A2N9YAX9_9GAMM|nr:hybrid sensor histidine kinase/response regulator [Beggiatoa leptomitoformis]ALG67014.1 response regulator [Beggiatoa leptomitoformis]AUI67610.1 response regulator [Beggiatoa leptomitoformis]